MDYEPQVSTVVLPAVLRSKVYSGKCRKLNKVRAFLKRKSTMNIL